MEHYTENEKLPNSLLPLHVVHNTKQFSVVIFTLLENRWWGFWSVLLMGYLKDSDGNSFKPIFTIQHSSSCHYVVHTRDHIMCPWEIARWPLTDSSHLRSHHMLLKTRSHWKLSSRFILYPHSHVGSKNQYFNQNNISCMDDSVKNIKYRCISYISNILL